MPEHIERGARLVVSFELINVKKIEGIYVPELSVEELLKAIKEYTQSACERIRGYDEDISNPFLCAVDFAVAEAAQKAVSALFAERNEERRNLEAKNQELETRLERIKGGSSAQSSKISLDDEVPF